VNTIKFDSPLIPGSQSWYFVIKSLAMDDSINGFITQSDRFSIRIEDDMCIMYHYNHECDEERPLFCFKNGTNPGGKIMYQTLVHTIKETWAEHFV
jgi:hypothetical protein